jgi:mannitol/fructose-specific phosphotransferase system IIA component (Ntr-type)
MTLADLLTPSRVIAEMTADEHWSAIVELIDHLVEEGSLAADQREPALSALKLREEQRSTGIGGGIAIPHSFLPDLDEVVTIFGRSTGGVDFCAVDRAPVHFIVLFLVPESQHTLHLKTLAAVAKILNSADTRNRLGAAKDESEIIDILFQRPAAA